MKNIFKKIIIPLITLEAKLVIKKYKPKVVAITGTVGKTSTKDAIFCALSDSVYTRKSTKSFNSDAGIPLTILGLPNGWSNPITWIKNLLEGLILIIFPHNYPKYLVLEIGASHPGYIEQNTKWLSIDTVVFTKMSKVPVHVEFFSSPEEIFQDKLSLLKILKSDGVIIFNVDDEMLKDHFEKVNNFRKISFGFKEDATVSFSNYQVVYNQEDGMAKGINFKINYEGRSMPINIEGTLGSHQIYTILAGLSVSISEGINLVKASEGLKNYKTPPGRMSLVKGSKHSLIIDDTYNSSPIALSEAIHVLRDIQVSGRKIAVIGDMMELGKHSIEQHKKAGVMVADFVDLLIVVGMRARYIAEGALEAGLAPEKIIQFDESRLAGKQLELILRRGDVVLVKGSQAVRMEKTVEEIMAEPLRKGELLARQDPQWKAR